MHKKIVDKNIFLKEIFGYDNFRYDQDFIIDSIIEKKENNLVIIPTGGGKSLIYQIAGSILKNKSGGGITLVISPLISLMKDQVAELNKRGISGIELSSHNTDISNDLYKIRSGNAEFVFVSPEKFAQEGFQNLLKSIDINLFVIDEAHCCTMWGHQFRPEYSDIGKIIKSLNRACPILGLTATANKKSIEDIKDIIFTGNEGNKKVNIHIGGYYRDNFNILTETDTTSVEMLSKVELLIKENKSGIIYFQTVKELQEYARTSFYSLIKSGKVGMYHGKGEKNDREDTQTKFIKGDIKVLLATTAFGMGVNKPDIDFVIHNGYPSGIESYYQEIGRAGRDGRSVDALLYKQSLQTQLFFIEMSYISSDNFSKVIRYLDSFSSKFLLSNGSYANSFKIKDMKSLSEQALGRDMYSNAIYSCLYKYMIIRKGEDGNPVVNINTLKKVIKSPSIYSDLDKIREYKQKQAKEMDSFFSSSSFYSIKNMNKYYGKANFLNSLNLSTYINILDFFGDEKGIKNLIENKSGKFDINNLKYTDYFNLKTTLSQIGRKDLIDNLTVKHLESNSQQSKKNELFFDNDIFEPECIKNQKAELNILDKMNVSDKKKIINDGLGLF